MFTRSTSQPDEMLTPRQAAAELNVRLDYLYKLLAQRDIEAVQIRGEWRIPRSAVEKHLAKPRAQNYRARHLAVMVGV